MNDLPKLTIKIEYPNRVVQDFIFDPSLLSDDEAVDALSDLESAWWRLRTSISFCKEIVENSMGQRAREHRAKLKDADS